MAQFIEGEQVEITRRRVQLAGLAVIGLTTAMAVPAHATAQHVTSKQAKLAAVSSTIQVVASGLNTPRGVTYDARNHRVLVAEAGSAAGDTGPCGTGEGGTVLCHGPTASVFSYSTISGAQSRIITGLASEAPPDGSFVLGLSDLSVFNGHLNGVFNLLGTPDTRSAEGPDAAALGTAARLDLSGTATPFADIAGFEVQKYGADQESDAYGLVTGGYGTVVANAGGHSVQPDGIGGNDLLLVKHDGTISQIAAFPQRVPAANAKDIVESVPTAVAQGPDGAFYVGELTGFPYYPGEARVWRVVPGEQPTVFAQGFTNIIDVTFDHEGRLLVLEIAKNGLLDPDQTGALIRVGHNGQQTVLASTGLTNPGGVVEVGRGVFYITNFTQSTGGTGELLKVTVHG